MPYLNVFSEGEVFRNGVTERLRHKSVDSHRLFAHLPETLRLLRANFWFFLCQNLKTPGKKSAAEQSDGFSS